MKLNKELKAQLKFLKRRKKLWSKYQRKMTKLFDQECYWFSWLAYERLPYLRSRHAEYKRMLRQEKKYIDSMGDTQGRIVFAEERIEQFDKKIMDLVIGEACKEVSDEDKGAGLRVI